jgi:primosomal protein N' (replication factor Y)
LLGPAPAPVARVAGRSRWQLLLHGPVGSPLPLPPGRRFGRNCPAALHSQSILIHSSFS